MNKLIAFLGLAGVLTFAACQKEPRNLVDKPVRVIGDTTTKPPTDTTKKPVVIKPWDINKSGFDFLAQMHGHWVGSNRVIADDYAWFGWDFRAISSSHVHGMFEGGSMGNLYNSFFVTDFKDTRTIMLRNGGVLNGIYRTSYFVLDSVIQNGNGNYYRFVDANGGIDVMSVELRFIKDSLYFNAYTSGLGRLPATRHMTFKAKKETMDLATPAANKHGYPKNEIAWDFSKGFNQDHLNGSTDPKSASYLSQGTNNSDLLQLAAASGDPYTIANYPEMAWYEIKMKVDTNLKSYKRQLYVSQMPLVDVSGNLSASSNFNRVLRFPELELQEESFLFTYMFPGNGYVTLVVDVDGDGSPSTGDYCRESIAYNLAPQDVKSLTIDSVWVQIK